MFLIVTASQPEIVLILFLILNLDFQFLLLCISHKSEKVSCTSFFDCLLNI